jgi:hypothetical protein
MVGVEFQERILPDRGEEDEKMRKVHKKPAFIVFFAVLLCFALAMPALAQEKKKEKTDKVWGTIVSQPADPSGKLAPVALETQKKEIMPLLNNAVAKKLEKIMGKKVEVEGKINKGADGKNFLEPWIFVQKDRPDAPTKKPKADAG